MAESPKQWNTATSLNYVDMSADVLKVATSAFNAPTITTVGGLGFDVKGINDFDISGSGASFAAMTDKDTGKSGLYTINLGTGAAALVGAFGIGGSTAIAPPLRGVTATVTAIPEPETYALMPAGLATVGCAARRRATLIGRSWTSARSWAKSANLFAIRRSSSSAGVPISLDQEELLL